MRMSAPVILTPNIPVWGVGGAHVTGGRRGERLVHAALDRQLDVVGIHGGLLGVRGVDFCIVDDGGHIPCRHKKEKGAVSRGRSSAAAGWWKQASRTDCR